jgi:hypothetical protein
MSLHARAAHTSPSEEKPRSMAACSTEAPGAAVALPGRWSSTEPPSKPPHMAIVAADGEATPGAAAAAAERERCTAAGAGALGGASADAAAGAAACSRGVG